MFYRVLCGVLTLLLLGNSICLTEVLLHQQELNATLARFPLKKASLVIWGDGFQEIVKNPFWQRLQQKFREHGYKLKAQDTHPIEASELILVIDKYIPEIPTGKEAYLYLMETPFSLPQVSPYQKEHVFRRIFTHRPDLSQKDEKYVFLPLPKYFQKVPMPSVDDAKSRDVLISMVLRNYYRSEPRSVYQHRCQTMRYLIENHPEDIRLYSDNWQPFTKELTPKGIENFKTVYQGYIENKLDVMHRTKFFLAYENAIEEGYISEKIVEGMEAGAIPVYWGAPDVVNEIPKDCFINRLDFASDEALYLYLKNMPPEVYQGYRRCLAQFVPNAERYHVAFDVEGWTDIVIQTIFGQRD